MPSFRTAIVAFVLAVAGCTSNAGLPASAPAASASQPTQWRSKLLLDHPLVGRVWDTKSRRMIDPREVESAATAASFVLLGEKHDNPDHHALQARILQAMIDRGRRPAVGFEMIETGKQEAVNQAMKTRPRQPGEIAAAVGWDESGWPPFDEYRPVFEAATNAGLPIIAANLPAVQVRLIVKHGPGAMPAGRFQELGLDEPLPADLHDALADEIREGHCRMLPEKLIERMVLAQRARDAAMAERLVMGSGNAGAVLIAGGGHVRSDRAVPRYLARSSPGTRVLSVAFVEVSPGVTDPAAYDTGADLLWFTPRWGDDDPCETMKAHMRGGRS